MSNDSVYGRERQWGWHNFQKHYYPKIGEFDSREEFECARFLDNEAINGRLKFWIRNLARNRHSFSLAIIDRHFYPDFVCVLPDDRILVVEYKGKDRWDTPKAREDRNAGNLWAELSGGLCGFVMVKEKDWDSIAKAMENKGEG